MNTLKGLQPERVFEIFEELCAIPHGSGDMERVSAWCVDFARKNSLRAFRDEACNVIIYKNATAGYENSHAVILQGHLDMVCQKTDDSEIDFSRDGLKLLFDGDFIRAEGTTLGADDGIAVAMILAILESSDIPHPPIEAVFTTDEEIGMLGAVRLDTSRLTGKTMINIDSECLDTVTVSCAGGRDFCIDTPIQRHTVKGFCFNIEINGLTGGHSGVEIDKNRVNADMLLARILCEVQAVSPFELISFSGGDKTNAIPRSCCASIVSKDPELYDTLSRKLEEIKEELKSREKSMKYKIENLGVGEWEAMENSSLFINFIACCPDGIYEMSTEISGLVESSQNMGIVKSSDDTLSIAISMRSSKTSVLEWLECRMISYSGMLPGARITSSGAYPPWEFRADSPLRRLYEKCYKKICSTLPKTEAIHAGLECGLFSSKIDDFDCISIGPDMYDIHTVEERLSISSVEKLWLIIGELLKSLK